MYVCEFVRLCLSLFFCMYVDLFSVAHYIVDCLNHLFFQVCKYVFVCVCV